MNVFLTYCCVLGFSVVFQTDWLPWELGWHTIVLCQPHCAKPELHNFSLFISQRSPLGRTTFSVCICVSAYEPAQLSETSLRTFDTQPLIFLLQRKKGSQEIEDCLHVSTFLDRSNGVFLSVDFRSPAQFYFELFTDKADFWASKIALKENDERSLVKGA